MLSKTGLPKFRQQIFLAPATSVTKYGKNLDLGNCEGLFEGLNLLWHFLCQWGIFSFVNVQMLKNNLDIWSHC